ncbi:MAG: hypothetical protein HOH04_03330 [Rhodospirillaceae bacterium]|nr:hypothetical protein [Rhodospirillaceae bacterium]
MADNNERTEPELTAPQVFIEAARAVSLGEAESLSFPPDEIIRIANDSALRRELISLFRSQIQDPDTKLIIIDYIAEVLLEEENDIANKEILAEGITRFVGRPAIGVTGLGIAAVVGGGLTIGTITLLSGGVLALAAVGGGWTYMKLKANNSAKLTKRLERLVNDLETD